MWKTFIGAFAGALVALIAFFGVLAALIWRWWNTPLGEKMKLVTPTPVPGAIPDPFPVQPTAMSSFLDPGYVWLWGILGIILGVCMIWLILEVRAIRVKKCPPS